VNAVAGSCNTDGLLEPDREHKILETYTKLYNTVKWTDGCAAALSLSENIESNWRDCAAIRIGFARQRCEHSGARVIPRPQSRDTAIIAFASVWQLPGRRPTDSEQFDPEKLCSSDILVGRSIECLLGTRRLDSHWPKANPATINYGDNSGKEVSETWCSRRATQTTHCRTTYWNKNSARSPARYLTQHRSRNHRCNPSGLISCLMSAMLTNILRPRSQKG